MSGWTREAALAGERGREQWRLRDAQGEVVAEAAIDVRRGKPLDVMALKGASLAEAREYAEMLAADAAALYGASTHDRAACPCCEAPAADARPAITVFGVDYCRCPACEHLYVRAQPDPTALDERFAADDEIAATYTALASVELRLAQVIAPKVDWTVETYRRAHGRDPLSVLDVGAGGGHFVEGARRAGLRAEGHEISRASRAFAREAFGLELLDADFLRSAPEPGAYDVITFFGLLEYTPDPAAFLDAARRALDPETGLLVVEVPRAESLSTAAQTLPGAVVARHLDPTTHVNCFSDASLASLLWRGGFRPVAAWYFGMDAYETLVQVAHALDDPSAVERLAERLLALQPRLDAATLCDDVIVAAVPEGRTEPQLSSQA